ncbi:MAG: histidine phosphatase family protein [Muribaculaceae bacterium]|nr:histidine phosphatase family protein [Muribaculaceae bacterium]
MFKRCFILTVVAMTVLCSQAADPTLTSWSWTQCQGSYMPYSVPSKATVIPDSLTPVMINHVGRHGARYPSSDKSCVKLKKALEDARAKGKLTQQGRTLLSITDMVLARAKGQWGGLDSLGMEEQRGIASRMYRDYPQLMHGAKINAVCSYSPRCIMSMDMFTHQLARLDNRVEIYTSSGRQNSRALRFFDDNAAYADFTGSEGLKVVIDAFSASQLPLTPLKKIVGDMYADSPEEGAKVVEAEWAVLTCLSAMGIHVDGARYFTAEEMNRLWSVANFKHYIRRTASTLSAVPAEIAAPLLLDIIDTIDTFVADSTRIDPVQLRFGHAETLMPLLSLMRLRGCYYLTNYFDTVGAHWCDFNVVPMAANLQMILLRSHTGRLYVLTKLNEVAMPLIPNDPAIFVPWGKAREYLSRCVPLNF